MLQYAEDAQFLIEVGGMTQQEPEAKPSLQALLVCERVDTAPDGTHTIHRVVDRVNVSVQIEADEPLAESPPVKVPLEFTFVTRWGAGVGHFKQHTTMTNPSGETVEFGEKEFWLPNKAESHTMLGRLTVGVSESGNYTLGAFLDNQKVGEYVLVVELRSHIRDRERHLPE